MFFRAKQHQQQEITPYPAYRKPDGTPYRSTIAYELPEKAKLYLVPSLSEDGDQQVEQATQCLNTSLNAESRARSSLATATRRRSNAAYWRSLHVAIPTLYP